MGTNIEFNSSNRAVVVLASYDAKALKLTLLSLSETLDQDETVVIILNGKRGIRSAYVEELARQWASGNETRFVVRPLNYGGAPYESIQEILEKFAPLQNKEFICKMDDDIIPLRQNWLSNLHAEYLRLEKSQKIGFVTPLINNNAWGFAQLIKVFDKENEFKKINNYYSDSGEGIVEPGALADGLCGTVWQYPYIAKWCHEWTLLDLEAFVKKTESLSEKEIPLKTHYSIGCIFFRKNLWNDISEINKETNFDELSIHLFCQRQQLLKYAIMNEPMGHLFYFTQRKANAKLLDSFAKQLAIFWQNNLFLEWPLPFNDAETMIMMAQEEAEQVQQEYLLSLFNESTQRQKNYLSEKLKEISEIQKNFIAHLESEQQTHYNSLVKKVDEGQKKFKKGGIFKLFR